ncbi:YceD family protein [Paenibacillus xerothermodurans]|uniref:DUF177 domain-containing protein n=1 Tax=Paenibacillus xerothermodurans TaxID=1977292 RepID=A0A2W1NSK9_PAEXE|nr:DUF177 domain-containing protein [Paenibacillus xerothermodurans]PZE22495.1 DUF177 domain-containing protein [Paenibacillus xerothermodurans]
MLIQLKELAKKGETVHIDETIDLTDVLQHRSDVLSFGPLHVHLHARYMTEDDVAEVGGQLVVDVEQPCARCLTPVKQTLEIPFDETFALVADESEPEDEEDETHFVTDEKIDLKPFVVENVLLALPFVPLCDEACQGLCPTCGANRNQQACDCKHEKIDPRLAGLADFFKE